MSASVKEVAAAVIVTNGKLWIIKYDEEPTWPWQLINYRYDGQDPVFVIRNYVTDEYGVKIAKATLLSTNVVSDPKTTEPMMKVSGVELVLQSEQLPKAQPEGITLKRIDPAMLNEYPISNVYRKFIDQVITRN